MVLQPDDLLGAMHEGSLKAESPKPAYFQRLCGHPLRAVIATICSNMKAGTSGEKRLKDREAVQVSEHCRVPRHTAAHKSAGPLCRSF